MDDTTGRPIITLLLGANFRILRVNNFSALFYFDLFQKKLNPAISLGYNLQLVRFLNTTVGITYQDGRINNIGAGLALKLTHLQFYVTSDRANSFVYPARASRADAHFGMNLVFGKPKKNNSTDKKKEEEEPEPEPVEDIAEPVKDSVQTVAPSVIEPLADTVTTVEEQVVTTPEPQQEINIDTVVQEAPVIVPEPAAITEQVTMPEEPRHETVKKGDHPDELPVSHYVIVGTFRLKENAQRYSSMLFDEGYANQFGFVTAKNVYYVYVYNSETLEQTREIRDRFRKMNNFQFAESWVLSVE